MGHVKVSFEIPEYTADIDGLGTLRLLEAIRSSGLFNKTRFYQHLHLNYMVKLEKFHKVKKLLFIHVLRMV